MRGVQNEKFQVNVLPADYLNASTSDLEGFGEHLSRDGAIVGGLGTSDNNILGDSTIIFHNDSLMLESKSFIKDNKYDAKRATRSNVVNLLE